MDDTRNNIYARWLADDISNEELDSLRKSGELAELEKLIDSSDDLVLQDYDQAAAFQKIKSKRGTNQIKRVSTWNWAVAASILIGSLGLFYWVSINTPLHEASYGEILAVAMPDDSRVTLNDGSSIDFDEDEYEVTREINLVGEALFEVKKGSSFLVKTKTGTVEVLGTVFNVRSWNESLLVQCFEGSVKVSSSGSDDLILSAGESARLDTSSSLRKDSIQYDAPFWLQGISRFKNVSLSEVFEEMERQYDIRVSYDGVNKSFNGAFTHQNLETALQEICKPMDLQFELTKDKKRIRVY